MKKSKLKQILALILTLTLMLTAIPLTALPAAAANSRDYGYKVLSETDKTCEIADCKGSAKESGGYTVTEDTFKGVISAVNANSKISTIAWYTTDAALTVKTDVPAAKAGDIITVSVDLSANSDLGSLQFYLTYNPDEFEYVAGSAKDNGLFGAYSINDENSGEVLYVGASYRSVNAAGTLLTAQFKVLKANSSFGIRVDEAYNGSDYNVTSDVNANSAGTTVACKHTGGSWTVVKEATCTEDGSKKGICVDCGAEVTETIPAGHSLTLHQGFAATCEADGEKDYYICSNCGKCFEDEAATVEIANIDEWKVIPATGHSFGEWKTALENSCTENGIKVRICAGCGKTETQPIPAKGHSFSDWVVTTEPTCTENGTETRICVTCNEAETRPVSAKGHSFGDWIVTTEATCTEAGVETRTCTACGKTETRPVSAKGHSLTLHQGFAAACEAAGEKDYYVCSDCGKYFEDKAATKEITNLDEWKVIPATGHNWVVSADGTKRTCTNCGAEEILVIPGDVNGDGKVSAVDARWALQCAAKKRTLDEKQTKAADMNKDGKITAVDARQILKKAAGKA